MKKASFNPVPHYRVVKDLSIMLDVGSAELIFYHKYYTSRNTNIGPGLIDERHFPRNKENVALSIYFYRELCYHPRIEWPDLEIIYLTLFNLY